jgi:hypothetical protein
MNLLIRSDRLFVCQTAYRKNSLHEFDDHIRLFVIFRHSLLSTSEHSKGVDSCSGEGAKAQQHKSGDMTASEPTQDGSEMTSGQQSNQGQEVAKWPKAARKAPDLHGICDKRQNSSQ